MSTTHISLKVDTDDPRLAELVTAVNDAQTSREERTARANLLTALALNEAYREGHDDGHRIGHDAGASPFLDGPWWRRAWTAARS